MPFTYPRVASNQNLYLNQVSEQGKPWGGGEFYTRSVGQLSEIFGHNQILLTQSCTSALELAAIALGLGPGDEVIVPSYTFTSSAGAFALRGANLAFADIDPWTMNIDPESIQALITSKTRAIVVVHYGGIPCKMEAIMEVAREHGLIVIEDAAQAIGATFQGQPLGSFGDLSCFSFHGTKNVSSGEGGALVVNEDSESLWEKALVAHEKGTDRHSFVEGHVDKYTWRSLGTSSTPSEFTAAVLSAQLEELELINETRRGYRDQYLEILMGSESEKFEIIAANEQGGNGHMFALLTRRDVEREQLLWRMRELGVIATSHYEPLHTSPFIRQMQGSVQSLPVTEDLAGRLVRLPMWSRAGLDVGRAAEAFLKSID